VSTIVGFSEEQSEAISRFICDLQANSSESQEIALYSLLAETLESYVGVDREILTEAFSRTIPNRTCNASSLAEPE
jgi:hypothetical protein